MLPTATNSVLGGVKVDGTTITINSSTGVISGANTYVLPTATNSVLGGVKKGNNINIAGDGTISVDLVSYTGNSTINGDLVVNSNLIVHGTSTTLNTDVYTTERLDITNSGTTNSTLTIKQTAAGNTNSIFNVIGSSSTTVFNVSSTGNVGIGTTNPSSKLHITTTSSTNLLDFRNSDNFGIYATSLGIGNRGNTLDFLARDYNSGGAIQTINVLSLRPEGNVNISEVLTIGSITAGVFNYVPKLVVYGAAAGTNASAIFKHPNDSQGIGIRYDGIFQTNTNANLFLTTTGTGVIVFNTNGADRMKIESSGTISTYNNNINVGTGTITATTFSGNATTAGNLTGTPNINVGTITTSGNVGIGTTNPVGRLHLHNTTANSDVSIRFSDGTSGATTNDGFSIGEDSNQRAYLWNNEDTDMAFATNKIERLTIKNDGNVGIGTNSNIQSKLTINSINTNVANSFDHSEAPLTITNPTATSISVLNDPKAVLNLCRTGTTGQAYSTRACFKLCRYENDSVNSRTRLDITLAHNFYDELNIMSLQSGGNVGIGITNPVSRLHLHNTTANSDVAIRFTDSTSGAGATNGFVIGENSTQKAYLWNYGNTDMLFATNNVERMIISNAGNVGIGTNSALSSLHLHKNATTQDVRMIISDNTSTSSLTRGLHLIKGTDNIGYLWNYENTPLILAANNAERMRIAENGNVGIGVSPSYKFHIKCVNGSEASGLHLDSSDTGVNQYALTIWPYVIAGSTVGWKFRTQSTIGGIQTPLTFDNAGNVILGGTISGNGSLLTSINATNISSGTIDSLRLPTATSSVLGGVKVDGTTITINSSTGVITSVGGGGSSQWTTSGINIYNANTGNVGIGTNDPATYKCQINGNLGATGNITAYYSDERLKNITEYVSDVLPVLDKINVFKYNCNDLAESFGYDKSKKEIGLSAQEIQKYYPEIVSIAPFDADLDKETNQIISKSGENYLTLDYERLVPVLLQAIKELNHKYTALEDKYNKIMPT